MSTRTTKLLLACGVLYGASYVVANDVVAAAVLGDYDRFDQAVSELSAAGAASRPFLVAMTVAWAPLMVAFGVGVWRAAQGDRWLQATGGIVVGFGVTSLLWLPLPMTAREDMVVGAAPVGDDLGHIAMAGLTVVLIVAQVLCGAVALGWRFRLYSLATVLVVLLFGALSGAQSSLLVEGEPTPWLGLYERISIGAWLVWMAVLAVVLWRSLEHHDRRAPVPAHAHG